MTPLLEVRNLVTTFSTEGGVVRAADGVSFWLDRGERLGLVGESGCGKSVTALSIMGLLPAPYGRVAEGEIIFDGISLLDRRPDEMRRLRGKEIAMIFQDPMSSLNPVLPIELQIAEVLQVHLGLHGRAARKRTVELLEMVGIPGANKRLRAYPHEFSGGMRQRVMIAMALACQPKLLIADEPTTALDVTIQAQILDLILEIGQKFHTAVLLITHDLGVVAGMTDRVAVMYAGRIVEMAPTTALFERPNHPYTRGLLQSVPRLDQEQQEELRTVQGMLDDSAFRIPGCRFAPRCPYAQDVSRHRVPPLFDVGAKHTVACWVDVAATDRAGHTVLRTNPDGRAVSGDGVAEA